MLLDKQALFSDKQDLAKAAGSYLSTNSMPLKPVNPTGMVAGATTYAPRLGGTTGSPTNDLGRGEPVPVFAQVTEAFVGAGATVMAQIVTSDTVDGSGQLNGTITVINETAAIPVAQLIVGYTFRLGYIPPGVTQNYVAIRYVIASATTTAGKVTSGIVMDKHLGQGVSI